MTTTLDSGRGSQTEIGAAIAPRDVGATAAHFTVGRIDVGRNVEKIDEDVGDFRDHLALKLLNPQVDPAGHVGDSELVLLPAFALARF
jgi:hypothetical protein